jgi:hypothetical protein
LNPRILSDVVSYDVVCNICQDLPLGDLCCRR